MPRAYSLEASAQWAPVGPFLKSDLTWEKHGTSSVQFEAERLAKMWLFAEKVDDLDMSETRPLTIQDGPG